MGGFFQPIFFAWRVFLNVLFLKVFGEFSIH